MEALLIELDRNNDGRLDRRELKNHPALMRRLHARGALPVSIRWGIAICTQRRTAEPTLPPGRSQW